MVSLFLDPAGVAASSRAPKHEILKGSSKVIVQMGKPFGEDFWTRSVVNIVEHAEEPMLIVSVVNQAVRLGNFHDRRQREATKVMLFRLSHCA